MSDEQKAREIVNRWARDHGCPATLHRDITAAIQAARREGMEAAVKAVEGLFLNPGDTILDADTLDEACDAIRALPVEPVAADPVGYEAAARFLFDLLDDIDTFDDMAKGNDAAYRAAVQKVHRRRFEVATTDGYTVTFLPTPPRAEGETT